MAPPKSSTAAPNTYADLHSDSETSPTTSPEHSSKPADSDPNNTLNYEEPDFTRQLLPAITVHQNASFPFSVDQAEAALLHRLAHDIAPAINWGAAGIFFPTSTSGNSPPHVGHIHLHQYRVQAHPFHGQLRDVVDCLVGHGAALQGGDGSLGASHRGGRHRQA